MRKPRRLFANKPLIRHWRQYEPATYWRFTWPAPFLGVLWAFFALVPLGVASLFLTNAFALPLWMDRALEWAAIMSATGYRLE